MKITKLAVVSVAIILATGGVGVVYVLRHHKQPATTTSSTAEQHNSSSADNNISVGTVAALENSDAEKLADLKRDPAYANAKTIEYAELFHNAGDYLGKYFRFTGEVIQVQGDPGQWQLRVNVTRNGEMSYWYDDTVYVESHSQDRVIEDDIISFTARMGGVVTYKSVLGADISLPYLTIYEQEVVGRN